MAGFDECMFSWLGRVLKLPGWKIIKRKPHPTGLESKTTACSVTGMLIDFEFQEGKDVMKHFEFIEETNKSSAWLLRLTKRWHNMEKRTVIADAAFAQVRAAVALYKIGGLYLIGNVKGAHKYFPKAALKNETPAYERDELVCMTKQADVRIRDNETLTVYATGWRATGAMVCTYVHTGGTNGVGSDRVKRKFALTDDGKTHESTYHVKRPKVSSEYQSKMGAIDEHNSRRQSARGIRPLEKVCITRDTKDRIFINLVSWMLINVYLAKKFFVWNGQMRKSHSEVQESIAMALIHNNRYAEETGANAVDEDGNDSDNDVINDPDDCVRHPNYKGNTCKLCGQRRTVYFCRVCSTPKTPIQRADTGPKGGQKLQHGGYMHFCKGRCFMMHKCGEVPSRKKRANPTQGVDFYI